VVDEAAKGTRPAAGTDDDRLVDELMQILSVRELTPPDIAHLLDSGRKLDARALDRMIQRLLETPQPRRVTFDARMEAMSADGRFAPAKLKMRAVKRQSLILKRLIEVYGTGEIAMHVLRELARVMHYEMPEESDLKIAGHFSGKSHTAALIAAALFVEPFDLWPQVLSTAGTAQGIFARDYNELIAARDTVLGKINFTGPKKDAGRP
jgi:hypothetical protein